MIEAGLVFGKRPARDSATRGAKFARPRCWGARKWRAVFNAVGPYVFHGKGPPKPPKSEHCSKRMDFLSPAPVQSEPVHKGSGRSLWVMPDASRPQRRAPPRRRHRRIATGEEQEDYGPGPTILVARFN